jgi:N-acetylneuraminic acid mutarotase
MIVWGGFGGTNGMDLNRNDGARFDPRGNVWRPMSTLGAPEARFQHSAIWTGREMLVFGGYTDSHELYRGAYADACVGSGGAYNPAADAWRPISPRGAPSPRFHQAALWTGNWMIIWGGCDAREALNDGAIYDPASDTWTPINTYGAPTPRVEALTVWTGREMIVWGGTSRDGRVVYNDGARYNPMSGQWAAISTNGAPIGRTAANAVWTGSRMMFWGGINDQLAGTGYLPQTVGILPPSAQGTNEPQMARLVGQTDGYNRSRYLDSGAVYDPATDSWTALAGGDVPSARLTTSVWTGNGLLIFGGYNGTHLNDAYCFYALKSLH